MSQARERVLVVDDEQDVLLLTSEIIQSLHCDVIEAASGPEALGKIAPSRQRVDLLITDLIMPGMTGRMLADAMAAWLPDLKVIFMSAYIDDEHAGHIGKDVHFIHKPYRADELRSLVKKVLHSKKPVP